MKKDTLSPSSIHVRGYSMTTWEKGESQNWGQGSILAEDMIFFIYFFRLCNVSGRLIAAKNIAFDACIIANL